MLVVDICNQALYRLGVVNPITSLDEGSAEANILKSHYEVDRDMLLTAFPWPWARRVVELAPLAGADHLVWSHAYAYPSNCLRIIRLFNASDPVLSRTFLMEDDVLHRTNISRANDHGLPVEYEVASGSMGRMIYTDLDGAHCFYTHKVEDPLLWDPLFIQALISRLAADACLPITGSDTRANALNETAQRAYYAAIGAMSSETREARWRRGRYVKARR